MKAAPSVMSDDIDIVIVGAHHFAAYRRSTLWWQSR